MKKIINGKLYNTETAKGVWEYTTPGRSVNDFNYYSESLYKKKTGEFFLAGEGHGATKYAQSYGDCSGWGKRIIPLSLEEAKEWAERVDMDVEYYIEVFGEVEE